MELALDSRAPQAAAQWCFSSSAKMFFTPVWASSKLPFTAHTPTLPPAWVTIWAFTGVYFAVVKEAPAQYSLNGQVCDPAVVTLTKDSTGEITITLQKARGSIDVVVEKDDGERTLSGLTVELKGKAKDGSDVSVSAVTDKDGVASFSDVLVGSYKISIAAAAGDKEKGQEYKLVDDATAVINEGENEAVTVKAKLVGTEDTEA